MQAYGAHKSVSPIGFPDSGNGKYAQKFTYKQWYVMACHQRAHMNFVENLPLNLILLLVMGLYYPTITLVYSISAVVGRFLYCALYAKKGAWGRMLGMVMDRVPLISFILYMTIMLAMDLFKNEVSLAVLG
uniref:MAPEG family protein n=1 Tax=Strombidium inclinatum TaxID=197538 RepID=A0A7S3IJ49_9SPIT|mmetsp:Transcript_2052/g.3077  ORF Transcript_2052/g.3077 Transcript_2052/m.3077 type:complete len:131 (+) Transcript_2052:162-554(+)